MYHTGSRNNYMLNLQCEEKIQVSIRSLTPVIQKLQETLFFIIKISYYFWLA